MGQSHQQSSSSQTTTPTTTTPAPDGQDLGSNSANQDALGAQTSLGGDGGILDTIGDAFDLREDEERLDAEEELLDFMSRSYSEDHFHPSTGRGNFDADYDPSGGSLTITVSVFFNFRNGSPTHPEWVAETSAGDPTFNAADFEWTDDEKQSFSDNAISMVENHWGRQYRFHNTRQYWESLPDVDVNINITEAADAGSAHYNLEVFKWPDDRVDGAHIDRPGVDHGADCAGHQTDHGTDPDHVGGILNENATNGIENPVESDFVRTTGTRNAYGQADTDNPSPITFEQDSSEISGAQLTALGTFATTMGGAAMPDFDLTVTGHSSSEGDEDHNQDLSDDRARVVSNELVSGGVKSQPLVRGVGEQGATEDPIWRRVDIVIGNFEATQTTVLHEFGHIFGLADEYPTQDGGSRDVGTEADHSDLAENLGLTADPVVAHHSDSIMSNGEVVEPYHYCTFLEALGTMTNTTGQWEAGPGPGPDLGPVDTVPQPSNGTAYA